MGRVILLLLLAGVVVAVAALIISVFSSAPAGANGAVGRPRSTGLQKVAYGLLLAVLFGVASGALGEG